MSLPRFGLEPARPRSRPGRPHPRRPRHPARHALCRRRQPYTYRAFLGALAPGAHELRVAPRPPATPPPHSGLESRRRPLSRGAARRIPTGPRWPTPPSSMPAPTPSAASPTSPCSPTASGSTRQGRPLLQYTAIFSNEDGGTSTRALMARWGRTTDIEYIYRAWLDASRRGRARHHPGQGPPGDRIPRPPRRRPPRPDPLHPQQHGGGGGRLAHPLPVPSRSRSIWRPIPARTSWTRHPSLTASWRRSWRARASCALSARWTAKKPATRADICTWR